MFTPIRKRLDCLAERPDENSLLQWSIASSEALCCAHKTPLVRRIGLFCIRHPIHVVSAILLSLCVTAVILGLYRTTSALKLARHNAQVANDALDRVFKHVEVLPASPDDVDLLKAIIPYYEEIVANPDFPKKDFVKALERLSLAAMRTGEYPLAEGTVRRLLQKSESASLLKRLAISLICQEKLSESAKVLEHLAERYASGPADDRAFAAWADLMLAKTPGCAAPASYRQKALYLLRDILAADPRHNEANSAYAQYLMDCAGTSADTLPDIPADPLELLDQLTTRVPSNGRYLRPRNHPSPQRVRLEELRQCLINHQTPRQAEFLKRIARLIADHFTQQVAD